ncbi:hypothetical protein [Streptomyces natalensis]|uniref:hypothetical protein n=1 Tax=Streptomyces natalensis TaxID=68242 RepID=UPI0012FEAEAD|nr:hypothetical protein [Streptomyces natalensis]
MHDVGPRFEEYVTQLADELIDVVGPAGRADLIADYATRLPLLVAMGLLGMDERYAAAVQHSVRDICDRRPRAARSSAKLNDRLRQLVAEKTSVPGPDLVSWMLHHSPAASADEITWQARTLLMTLSADATTCIGQALDDDLVDETARGAQQPPTETTTTPPRSRLQPTTSQTTANRTHHHDQAEEAAHRALSLLTETTVETAVCALRNRLRHLRLTVPRRELLYDPTRWGPCPRNLPVRFVPAKPIVTGPVRWLPDPIFTTQPPAP